MELFCNCPLKGKEILLIGMIPLLSFIHYRTRIGNRMVASVRLFLRQDGTKAFARCIRFQKERLIKVGEGQNGSLEAGFL